MWSSLCALKQGTTFQGGLINYVFFLKGGAGCAFPCMLGISVTSGKESARRGTCAPGAARPVGRRDKRGCWG